MPPIDKLPKTGYVFGASTNPITSVRAGEVQKPAIYHVQNLTLNKRLDDLNAGYGQSPVKADIAGAHELFGDAEYGRYLDVLG